MPVIAAFNSKGGSAKSTAVLVIADALARRGASVSVIDTDVQRSIALWAAGNPNPRFSVVAVTETTSIHRVIREESARSAWVLIDMAGFTSDMRTPVMSRADLVIVPMQASPEDARLAALAFKLIGADAETLNKAITTRILWARTVPNMVSRVERKILAQIVAGSVPTLATHLHERSAYKAMFLQSASLAELDPADVNGLEKAVANADELAAEVVSFFTHQARTQENAA